MISCSDVFAPQLSYFDHYGNQEVEKHHQVSQGEYSKTHTVYDHEPSVPGGGVMEHACNTLPGRLQSVLNLVF